MPGFNKSPVRRKLVIVGDGSCGKTCMLFVFSKKFFPTDYTPTVFENYVTDIEVKQLPKGNSKLTKAARNAFRKVMLKDTSGKQQVELELWDTAGQEDYDRIRPLSYSNADVVVICFSIDSPTSLKNVVNKWYPEVKYFCRNVPILLVGNKKDLRSEFDVDYSSSDSVPEIVDSEEGYATARRIGAFAYIECSAKNNEGIDEVFERAAQAGLRRRKQGTCVVM